MGRCATAFYPPLPNPLPPLRGGEGTICSKFRCGCHGVGPDPICTLRTIWLGTRFRVGYCGFLRLGSHLFNTFFIVSCYPCSTAFLVNLRLIEGNTHLLYILFKCGNKILNKGI